RVDADAIHIGQAGAVGGGQLQLQIDVIAVVRDYDAAARTSYRLQEVRVARALWAVVSDDRPAQPRCGDRRAVVVGAGAREVDGVAHLVEQTRGGRGDMRGGWLAAGGDGELRAVARGHVVGGGQLGGVGARGSVRVARIRLRRRATVTECPGVCEWPAVRI